jgi:hypothetical protein
VEAILVMKKAEIEPQIELMGEEIKTTKPKMAIKLLVPI